MLGVGHGGRGRPHGVAENPVDAHAHQADAYDQDDGAGDHGREEAQHAADGRGQQQGHHARAYDRAEDQSGPGRPGRALGHGHHGRDARKGHAHHHRQPDAEPLGRAHGLDQRDQAAAEQVGRDQHRHLFGRQVQRAADDQRHGHGAGIHHQHMLQTEGREAAHGELFVNGVERSFHGSPLRRQRQGCARGSVSIQKLYTH
ncbi:hypothetical protein D3C78_1169860 [compost metagenome]